MKKMADSLSLSTMNSLELFFSLLSSEIIFSTMLMLCTQYSDLVCYVCVPITILYGTVCFEKKVKMSHPAVVERINFFGIYQVRLFSLTYTYVSTKLRKDLVMYVQAGKG